MLTTIPREITTYIENNYGSLRDFSPASGGCINNGGTITTASGPLFVKWNSAAKFPGMFEAEARGLDLLRDAQIIKIPDVKSSYEGGDYSCLVLQQIDQGSRSSEFWETLGRGLADIHKQSADYYGLDHDNYMGSLRQYNQPNKSWVDFFVKMRLKPQIELAEANKELDGAGKRLLEGLISRLDELLALEKPALVHGDLWSGNFMVGPEGQPVLIDPAVAYAHREVDLAMTTLFGGFDDKFYAAYREYYPLTPGFEERFEIYNLYPLLIHVNLFGGGYYRQVLSILKRYA